MKVALVTGSYPPDVCGIGDYSRELVTAMQGTGVEVDVISAADWGAVNASGIAKRIDRLNPDVIHIQYPTVGYGWGLAPQVLSLVRPGVVTLHEASQSHILRKVSLFSFLRSKHVVFTSFFERNYALRFAPWMLKRSSVIPIGSNIPVGTRVKDSELAEIVYFGVIQPKKGIEQVLTLAQLIKEAGLSYRVRVIGLPDPRWATYLEKVRSYSVDLPVRWEVGLSNSTVAELLARSRIAYVPFPDGASERRGSLLALLANGVATITTLGPSTPRELHGAVEFAHSPKQALQILQNLVANSNRQRRLAAKGRAYASRFSWDAIAREHNALYERLLL
jgi:glycosyltransferase involved in cell wall biosynthesis